MRPFGIVDSRLGFNMTRKSTMSLIVCKFGGTSVASPERIQMVAKKLIAKKQAGHQVVAVVSAMGKTTDELVGLAASLNDNPPAREMDRLLSTGEQVSMTLLAMAIEARGYKAMSFTGRQAGIETDGTHAKAKIVKVHNERIMEALNRGVIAVVAGFQGIDANGDITTLGRGGSDTTAVAVAHGPGRRRVRDLLRRGRRVHGRPARVPARQEARRHLLRRHA